MDTNELMQISLELVGMKEIPADSAIYVPGRDISHILYGIDIGIAELQYAKEHDFDCVIAHHPIGLTNHWKVFNRHLDQMVSKGISKEKALEVIKRKMLIFKTISHANNYDAVTSFARLLNIPFLNIHCPSDELGRRLITQSIEELMKSIENPTLKSLIDHLTNKFYEFQKAKTSIEILKGQTEDLLGNWIFSHGAFTNGGSELAKLYYEVGVNTVIYIHIAPSELLQLLNLEKGSLIITGHLASDSIGINPFLNVLEDKNIEITAIGGLIR